MKKSYKTLAVNLLLMLSIFAIIGVGYLWFVAGPARAYERQDVAYIERFLEGENYDEAQLLSRFSYDTVYYIIEVSQDEKHSIVWFTHTFDRQGEHDLVDYSPVMDLAAKYGVSEDNISFGVYNDDLIYVLKKENFEMFVSVDSLEMVLQIGGVY